jgi:hypothetical protein
VREVTPKLREAGCSFVVSVPTVHGNEEMYVTAEQAAKLLEHPTSVYAEVNNLSLPEYTAWISSGGSVLCRALTAKGRPCRKAVTGLTLLNADEWKAHNEVGGYCVLHGG